MEVVVEAEKETAEEVEEKVEAAVGMEAAEEAAVGKPFRSHQSTLSSYN